MIKGKCDCGKVSFQVEAVRDTVTVCHCSQCRRTSGHVWASTHAQYDKVHFTADEGLTWYNSSDFAKRGFCKFCGSSLFYRMNDENGIAIAAGCIDAPSNLEVSKHIFVKDKGDYYEITDDALQIQKF
ncbi:aldehyde-activating protein [Pseudovibrio japonicus]|uniref:Aldehyde-activating protein n=1 Tax=Pseudovibrio japonicus TaxID=366534 RepID=A0ABQ3EKT6_9HYPH|nr:GFA family protein [Pseudovibrio japonicus]GHB44755.1 aldehyde-activating protein [Pseudovibrio japonicus]